MYGQPPPQGGAGQKRSSDEPHTPTLPPPNPGAQAQVARDGQYHYPDPTGLTAPGASPASSTASFNSTQPHAQPYYAQHALDVRHASPQSAYSYDASRASSSPHLFVKPDAPALSTTIGLHHGMPQRTPTPGSKLANAQRYGVNINELVGPAEQEQVQQASQTGAKLEERTSTDSSMVQALNRGPK